MAIIEIPVVGSIANYGFTTVIGDSTYTFDLGWNNRDRCWYVNVTNADGTTIAAGIKACLGAFLGRTYQNAPPFNAGVFVASDTSRQSLEAGFDDFGGRVRMRYFLSEDLIASIQKAQLDAATQ